MYLQLILIALVTFASLFLQSDYLVEAQNRGLNENISKLSRFKRGLIAAETGLVGGGGRALVKGGKIVQGVGGLKAGGFKKKGSKRGAFGKKGGKIFGTAGFAGAKKGAEFKMYGAVRGFGKRFGKKVGFLKTDGIGYKKKIRTAKNFGVSEGFKFGKMAGFAASEGAIFGSGKKKAIAGKMGTAGFKKGLGAEKKYLVAGGVGKAGFYKHGFGIGGAGGTKKVGAFLG